MRKAVKISAILAALFLAAAGLGTGALKFYLTPDRVQGIILAESRKSLGREVRVGRVSADLVRGLVLSDVAVSERPDFSAGTFARARSFAVRLRLLPLLHHKVEIARVSAEGLKVTLIRRPDGTYNFSEPAPSTAAARAPVPAGPSALTLFVSRAAVRDARIEYRDAAAGRQWTVAVADAKFRDFQSDGPFGAELDLVAQGRLGDKPFSASARFSGRLDAGGGKPERMSAVIQELRLEDSGRVLFVSGRVADASAPKFDLSGRLGLSGAEPLLITARGEAMPSGPSPEARAVVHLDIPRSLGIPGLRLPSVLVLPRTAVDAKLRLAAGQVIFEYLRLRTGPVRLEAAGTVKDLLGKPRLRGVAAKLRMDLPGLKGADLPFLKLPAGLVVPAMVVDSGWRLDGDDALVDRLHIATKAGVVDIKGSLRGALAGRFQPSWEVKAKLDLPSLRSADLPFNWVPPGLVTPAALLEADTAGGLDAVNLRRLRLIMGKSDLEASGSAKGLRGREPAWDLTLKCRSFVLEELAAISPRTRSLKFKGGGSFALGLRGPLARPSYQGNLRFRDLSADMAGLPLRGFQGTASFDEKRVSIPDLKGQVANGILNLSLLVRDYGQQPFIELDGSLDHLDLGRYLAAKTAWAAQANAVSPQPGIAAAKTPLATKGKLSVGVLLHPNATVRDVKVVWDIRGITPDLESLDGFAQLAAAGGEFSDIGALGTQSGAARVLIMPFMVIQKMGSLGGIRIFPDFNDISFTEIAGDYGFEKGVMTVKDTYIDSDAGQVSAAGVIDLPTEGLDLVVTAQLANVAPVDIQVSGTLTHPKSKVRLGKFFMDHILRLPAPPAPAGADGR